MNDDGRSAFNRAVDHDAPIVQFDNVFDQGQSQPHTAAFTDIAAAKERFVEARLIALWNADSLIGQAQHNFLPLALKLKADRAFNG